MARLIDADAFIKEQCNSCDGCCEKVDCDCLNCDSDCRCDMIKDLQDAPTISPNKARVAEEYRDTIIKTLHKHRMQMDESYDDSDFALGYAEAFKVVCMMPLPEAPKEETE